MGYIFVAFLEYLNFKEIEKAIFFKICYFPNHELRDLVEELPKLQMRGNFHYKGNFAIEFSKDKK